MSKKKTVDPELNGVIETNEQRFRRLTTRRMAKAIKAIRAIAPLSNRRVYDYTNEQSGRIEAALKAELDAVKRAFAGNAVADELFTLG